MAVNNRPRLLIEEWLPAAAIGVECMRERGMASALPPHSYLHVWWARRPLAASRAAVLGSLLPADFPRDVLERLLGFGRPGSDLVAMRRIMDTGVRLGGFGCGRAFGAGLREDDLAKAYHAAEHLWGKHITIIDPMSGGGSIPFECARLGFQTLANEYNSVACSILEATVDYPFRFGQKLVERSLHWGRVLKSRFIAEVGRFFPKTLAGGLHRPDGYIFARTVPCPDTGFSTPLVPDWYLLKTDGGTAVAAMPTVDESEGRWRVDIREIGNHTGQLRSAPAPTYSRGKGVSLFSRRQISSDYIKAMAQQGRMLSELYAVAVSTPRGVSFASPQPAELKALTMAEREIEIRRPIWERTGVIPTEEYPLGTSDERPRLYGMPRWADMYSPRQLLCMGTLVEALRHMRAEICRSEGQELGQAIIHLLAIAIDKFANFNCISASWASNTGRVRGHFDRHDYSFKATWSELAACGDNQGIDWAIRNTLKAWRELSELPRALRSVAAAITQGSATSLPQLADKSITAVVVDPPYADNVQYSEMADFFYVWLKRTQGHRRPEWFSTYLCDHDQEAVVNVSRHRRDEEPVKEARKRAHEFYQRLMTDTFRECRRILRDDGVLTVMFTHKKQEAWEALFGSLIRAGFIIEATWPVKTESEHSLHQARKNAAQSTVILVSRKRSAGAGVGYFDATMREEIRQVARESAERLKNEGLNAVDQLVGSFGPAMEVYSRYDEVRTDTGDPVGIGRAIDEASDAITRWRIEQLAAKGLEGVEPEGQFYLLCWDVLSAAEFRFNEAKLLGHAVGMDVDQLITAGLVSKSSEKIKILPAKERRRERALEPDEVFDTLYGPETVKKKRTKKQVLKVHPNDPQFRTALDGCHALALRYTEAKGGTGGIGSAKALMRQQGWGPESAVAKLMEALVRAAPEAVKFEKGQKSAAALFPEFRAWHEMLKPLFGIEPPEWKEKQVPQGVFAFPEEETADSQDEGLEDEETDEGEGNGLSEE